MTTDATRRRALAFRPAPRTNIKAVRHITYTCEPDRYALLQAWAAECGISLKELLRQSVDFALQHRATLIESQPND